MHDFFSLLRTTLPLIGSVFVVTTMGCSQPAPFTLTLENNEAETRYLAATPGGTVRLPMQFEIGGSWEPVFDDDSFMCSRRCGEPGVVACPAIAWIETVWAILPGESYILEHDGSALLVASRGCTRDINLDGPIEVEICDGAAAEDWNDTVFTATTTGLVDSQDGLFVVNPRCRTETFDPTVEPEVLYDLNGG